MSFRFDKFRQKYRIVNMTRFAAVVLVFIFAVTAVLVVIAKNDDPSSNQGNATVTPIAPSVTPEPEPEPPKIEIPEGKILSPLTVVIDAGHGGRDPGTVSTLGNKLYEKDVTLYIAKKVEELLTDKGIKVVLTREGEDHLNDVIEKDLLGRAEIANNNDASLFVSIHVNAYDPKLKGAASVNGMEVYYFNKETTYTDFSEKQFAQIVADEIVKANGINFRGIISNPFSVLRNTQMPAILVETAYITNKNDNALLSSNDFRDKTAEGITDGIVKTFQEIGVFEHEAEMYVFKEAGE